MRVEIKFKRKLNSKGGWVEYQEYYLDGVRVSKKKFDKALYPVKQERPAVLPVCKIPARWPKTSNSMAVHPTQVQEAQKVAAEKGCPTEYTKRGKPIFRDKQHMRKYLKAHSAVNYDSYD